MSAEVAVPTRGTLLTRGRLIVLAILGLFVVTFLVNGFLFVELCFLGFWTWIFIGHAIWSSRRNPEQHSFFKVLNVTFCYILGPFIIYLLYGFALAFGTMLVHNMAHARVQEQCERIREAILRYHDEHHHLPPGAVMSPDGKPLLSWRVAILPQLGRNDLYEQFRLNEPWDSPHNVKLLEQMPDVYGVKYWWYRQPPAYHTFAQLYVAPGAVFEPDRQRTLTELDAADGRHTIIGAWAERAVPWTKPEDIPVSLDQPIPMPGNVMEREPFPIARFIFQMYQKKPFARTVLMRIEDVHNWWFVGPDRLEWLRPRITWNGGEKVEEY